jgi:hypothetical protein
MIKNAESEGAVFASIGDIRITPFGNYEIKNYKEEYERFQTTNYFCVNKSLL